MSNKSGKPGVRAQSVWFRTGAGSHKSKRSKEPEADWDLIDRVLDDAWCPSCGRNDARPPQHCQDCPEVEKLNGGCERCNHVGLASLPPYDRTKEKTCPACLHEHV